MLLRTWASLSAIVKRVVFWIRCRREERRKERVEVFVGKSGGVRGWRGQSVRFYRGSERGLGCNARAFSISVHVI
jgi:hypothetical protein